MDFEIYGMFQLLITRCQLEILQVCVLGIVQFHSRVADIRHECETTAEQYQPVFDGQESSVFATSPPDNQNEFSVRQTDQFRQRYGRASLLVCTGLLLLASAIPVHSQDDVSSTTPTITSSADQDTLDRLESIGRLIDVKRKQRDELNAALKGSSSDVMQDERSRLVAVAQDLAALRSSFEHVLLDDVDTELMAKVDNSDFNWRRELVEIVEPLLSSLKSLTKRPRQLAELRNSIDLDTRRLAVAEKALLAIDRVPKQTLARTRC